MSDLRELKAVIAQPGRPLYQTVRDVVREAVDRGVFQPGEQMPNTKDLSQQLSVSLVTAHRALQELVASGVLQRSQGRGTFVHQRYLERRSQTTCRIGLVFHRESSLADFYHSQILEGVRQAANELGVDLILLRFGEDVRNECNGYLFVNPLPDELGPLADGASAKQPILIVGARSTLKGISYIDADNVDLAHQAVDHLAGLGHSAIGYVGGADQISNSRDRWLGFSQACRQQGISPQPGHVIKTHSWRMDDSERMALIRVLSSPDRPTAIFAAGYYFALDVYAAAAMAGLRVPGDLSIVGVDDTPSAAHLSPPLTTLRQPLAQIGHAAITGLCERIRNPGMKLENRTLRAELVIRRSSGTVGLHRMRAPLSTDGTGHGLT